MKASFQRYKALDNKITFDYSYYLHLQAVTDQQKIYPACLPTKQRSSTETCSNERDQCAKAFNSGWSKPLPQKFLENHASNFLNGYSDFYKQYQYQMEVWEKCNQDENIIYVRPSGNINAALEATNITYPTETYYPPGEYKSHDDIVY